MSVSLELFNTTDELFRINLRAPICGSRRNSRGKTIWLRFSGCARDVRRITDEEHWRVLRAWYFPLLLFASNSRGTEPLSLLPIANKQICLSLGTSAALPPRRRSCRCSRGNNRGSLRVVVRSRRSDKGNLRCTLVLPLSSLVPISSPVFSLSLSSLSRTVPPYFSVLHRSPFSSLHVLSPCLSLSYLPRDLPFYSSPFCPNPVACRTS